MFGLTEWLLILVVAIFLAIQYSKPKTNLPPGPPGLPLLGNILQVMDRPYLKSHQWFLKYGKMFTTRIGRRNVVFINDAKIAKEVLFDSDFTARPETGVFELFTGGQYGIIFTNGKQWEEQRRWSLRKLRDFGFGKTSMEGIIMDEVNEVVNHLKDSKEKALPITDIFNIATLNSLWSLLTGSRMKQDDPRLKAIMKDLRNIIPVISRSGLLLHPWMKYVFQSAYQEVVTTANSILGLTRGAAESHFETHEEGASRDFVDEYINEIKSTTDTDSSFYKENGKKNLTGLLSDLLQAGSETTSNTINWSICYLSHFPEVQKKIQKELDSVLGQRSVSLSDKANLPYTEAVILETLRYSSIVGNGVPHQCTREKKIEGYTIPEGTWIFTNIYSIHHDPKVWGDPVNFRPERFLSDDGKKVVKNENLIPFQIGRRQCLGESLARDSLFLFISTIFQKFEISKLEKEMPQPVNSIFLVPETYHFVFKSRE